MRNVNASERHVLGGFRMQLLTVLQKPKPSIAPRVLAQKATQAERFLQQGVFFWLALLPIAIMTLAMGGCGKKDTNLTNAIASSTQALNVGPVIGDFAVYGDNSVWIKDRVHIVGGDVGVRKAGAGPFLYTGYELAFTSEAQVPLTRNVIGNRVLLQNRVQVGDVQTNQLTNQSSTYTHQYPFPTNLPALPTLATVSPGTSAVTVASGGTQVLAPGAYGAVTVGYRGILRLQSGIFHLASIQLGDEARIEVLGAVQIRVAGRISTLARNFVVAAAGVTLQAGEIRIEVKGKNGTGGGLNESPKAAVFGNDLTLQGIVIVPNGTLSIGQRASLTGAFVGKDVLIDIDSLPTYQSGAGPLGCSPASCDDGNPCTADSCSVSVCKHIPVAAGTTCTDGNACNGLEACDANGVCQAGTPVVCTASDPCHVAGVCDPTTGICTNPAKVDGSACDDGSACSQTDTCQAGACVGSNPVVCAASDACHTAGTCDETTGACTNPVKADGSGCNDGNACTQSDACQAGACQGNDPKTCVAQDFCHLAGICDPTTGLCSNPAKPDGTGCNDENSCTQSDSCQAGVCTGAPVLCLASDECHEPGVCDPSTGQCTDPIKPECVNKAPIVSASASPDAAMVGQAVLVSSFAVDDGNPMGSVLSYAWHVVNGPGAVAISTPASANTMVTFSAAGDYVLQVEVSDSEKSGAATVAINVRLPDLAISGVSVVEGHSGSKEAVLTVSLSTVAFQHVSVEYQTHDGTALAECDYLPRFGTIEFQPGETLKSIAIPIRGDQAVETDERLSVVLGNAAGCNVSLNQGTLVIQNDDAANRPPTSPNGRIPFSGATEVSTNPTLAWSSDDPDGEPVVFSVYLGASFSREGQQWTGSCPSGAASPEPRAFAASAYDDLNDRLILFGGEGASGLLSDVWVLVNASGMGGSPVWQNLQPPAGPVARKQAVAAYDRSSNHLVLHGGCAGDCSAALSDTWLLSGANGLGDSVAWKQVAVTTPLALHGHAAAYSEEDHRLMVFGGYAGANAEPTADIWLLEKANEEDLAIWRLLPTRGAPSGRGGSTSAYDHATRRLIVFGGKDAANISLGETWILEGVSGTAATAAWRLLPVTGAVPPPRWGHGAGYDSAAQRLIVYGGTNGSFSGISNFVFSDTWLLDVGDQGAIKGVWTQISNAGDPGRARAGAAVAYSPNQNRLIAAGGLNNHESEPWLSNVAILQDAIGTLPLVTQNQLPNQLMVQNLSEDTVYFWRVVAKDGVEAEAGAAAIAFTPQVNQDPFVNAGPDQTVTTLTTHLQGLASDDGLPTGKMLSTHWTLVEGDSAIHLGSADALVSTATFSGPGIYVFRLTADDGEKSAYDEVIIRVVVNNALPVVDAGPDQTLVNGVPAVLAGTVSDDGLPTGAVLRVVWSQTSGPVPAIIETPEQLSTTVNLPSDGTYLFRLTASDSTVDVFDEVQVIVSTGNHPPTIVSTPVTDFVVNGDPGVPSVVDLTNWSPIRYTVSHDSQGPASWVLDGSHTIATQKNNADPSILLSDISLSQDRMEGDFRVIDTADDDFVGFVFGYQDQSHFYLFDWKRGTQSWSGLALQGMSVKVVSASTAINDIDLWPTSGNGERVKTIFHNSIPWQSGVLYHYLLDCRPGQFSITITNGANLVAQFSLNDQTYLSGRFGFYNYSEGPVEYKGFRRSELYSDVYAYKVVAVDPDNDSIAYSLVQAPAGMQRNPATGLIQWPLSASSAGEYPIIVRATDQRGLFSDQRYLLHVENRPSQPPQVNAGSDQVIALPTRTVSLLGTATDDGKPVETLILQWNAVESPGSVVFSSANALATSAWFSRSGTYTLRLSATDTQHVSSDDVTIVVGPSEGSNLPPVVDPGVDDETQIGANLVRNGSNEEYHADLLPLGWTVQAGVWTTGGSSGNLFEGERVFRSTASGYSEISQEIDVSRWAASIDEGTQNFLLTGWRLVSDGNPKSSGQVVLEYLLGQGAANPINRYTATSGSTAGEWVMVDAKVKVPAGTRWIRIRLMAWRFDSTTGDVAFDAFALRAKDAMVLLNGTAYDDELPVPGQLTNQWTTVGSADGVKIVAPTALHTLVSFSSPGEYFFQLSASDGALSSEVSKKVTVRAQNRAPSINVPERVIVTLPGGSATVMASLLDGDGPLPVAIHWMGFSGSEAVAIDSPYEGATTIRVTQKGRYRLRVVAFDGEASGVATVEVICVDEGENLSPVVYAGPDLNVEWPRKQVTLAGQVEDDGKPVGQPLALVWEKVLGPGSVSFSSIASATTQVTFASPGIYRLRLSASDSELMAQDDVIVTVRDPNAVNMAPVVTAGSDSAVQFPNCQMDLHGAVADDGMPAGSAVEAQWSVIDGPTNVQFDDAFSLMTKASLFQTGRYTLRLTATDGQMYGADDVVVVCADVNQAPVVAVSGPSTAYLSPSIATLVGSVSDDGLPVGSELQMAWTKVSGPGTVIFSAPSAVVSGATFGSIGTYVVQLEVTDGILTSFSQLTLDVMGGNQPPVVEAGPNDIILMPTRAVTLSGSVIDDGLPTGSAVSLHWTEVSGPGLVQFGAPRSANTTATFDGPGIYVLQLHAHDTEFSASDLVTVTVQGTPQTGTDPHVMLTAPGDMATVTSPVDVRGTVSSESLLAWRLEYSEPSLGDDWQIMATGSTTVSDAVLGRFDTTLLQNGIYQVRLTATDTSGRTASDSRSLVVRGNLKVGPFTLTFKDSEIPVSGIPIQILRMYDSRILRKGDFGIGWGLDVSGVRISESGRLGKGWVVIKQPGFLPTYCVRSTRPQRVMVTLSNGRVYEFEPVIEDGCQTFSQPDYVTVTFKALPGTHASLVPTNGGNALVQGNELYDDVDFRVLDPNQYTLTLLDGQQLVIGDRTSQKPGVQSLSDLNGNMLTFGRDGITHSSGKAISFTRDSDGRITSISDPRGSKFLYNYDIEGNLASTADPEGNVTRFAYHPELPHYLRDIIDPRGVRAIRNDYDVEGRLVHTTDANGKKVEYTHNLADNEEKITDRNGAQRTLKYDQSGNVVLETDALDGVISRTFDAEDNRTSETDALGNTTYWKYDAVGNVIEMTDPLGKKTGYTYNNWLQVLKTTDALGRVTENGYNNSGNLHTEKDALGNTPSFEYDRQGNQTARTNRLGHKTTYNHDLDGNVTKEIDANGKITEYTLDTNGNRLTETRTRTKEDGTQETLVTRNTYDKNNRLLSTTHPDGSVTGTSYNAAGLRETTTDALGRVTRFTYNDAGQLIQTSYPDGTSTSSTYDYEGRRLTSTDRAGKVTTMEYDRTGRLVKTTHPDGTSTSTAYYLNGWVFSTTDEKNHTTLYEYDPTGRQTKVIDALGNETTFTYDAVGNQLTVTDARGNRTTSVYDALNRLVTTKFPDTTQRTTTYDKESQRTAETDQAGKSTTFAYDALGRLGSVTDALNQTTYYQYDELGNRILVIDAAGKQTKFAYDKLGRETKRILPDGKFEVKGYNLGGELISRTDFQGRTTTYSYDVGGRLTGKTYPDFSTVGFSYSPTGRRLTAVDARGTTKYSYNDRDRLTTLEYPNGRKLEYGYDAAGNRTSLSAKVGTTTLTTTYTHDILDRIASVTDPDGRVFGMEYDNVGSLAMLLRPNGVDTTYTHDGLNRLTNVRTATRATEATVASYAYTLGPTGIRTKIDEGDGTVRAYEYDDLYRLTKETVTGGTGPAYEKSFAYDQVSNRMSQVTTGTGAGSVGYTYDSRDRLMSEGGTAYGWTDNGNLMSKAGEASYEWDFEDRLTRVVKADGTVVENVYDVDGVLVRTAVTQLGGTAKVTDLLVDTSGGLSHVVAEVDGTGAVTALYVRAGDMLLEEIRGGAAKLYEADGLGSVRGHLDASGARTNSWNYDAFGTTLSQTGTSENPYQFAGERWVGEVGMYQNRARWLLPSIGAFISEDPLCASPTCHSRAKKYAYAYGNPVDIVDPTGLDGSIAAMTAVSIGYATLSLTSMASMVGTVALATATACAMSLTASMILQETNLIAESNGGPCQARQPNRMRVQLQQSRSGVTLHTLGLPIVADQRWGVAVRSVQALLGAMYVAAGEGLGWFPLNRIADLGSAIVLVSRNLNAYPPAGTQPRYYTVEKAEFGEFRVEVENLRGINLRRF